MDRIDTVAPGRRLDLADGTPGCSALRLPGGTTVAASAKEDETTVNVKAAANARRVLRTSECLFSSLRFPWRHMRENRTIPLKRFQPECSPSINKMRAECETRQIK